MTRRLILVVLGAIALHASAAYAQPTVLQPELGGLAFLIGHWGNGQGEAVDAHARTSGTSSFSAEAGGAVILRRDHTTLTDGAGKPIRGFDQVMTIYAEGSTLHADYFDPNHIIHYDSAEVQPGKSVVFSSSSTPSTPAFRLTYTLTAPHVLGVEFSMMLPGGSAFRTIAAGTMQQMEKPQ